MCGIAGIISYENNKTEAISSQVVGMCNLLHHRGPTQTGFFKNDFCSVGNARLAITDISARSNLPMVDAEESTVLAYNGYVSNFQELKKKYSLEQRFIFKGTSDSEVLLYLFKLIGIDFVKELTGMFSLFIYSKPEQKAWLVRDFFGIKPLFYSDNGIYISFASEIKSFYALKHFSPHENYEGLYNYFTLAYIPGEQTAFSDIKELRPGHFMCIDFLQKKSSIHQYHMLNYKTNLDLLEQKALSTTKCIMRESVHRNLVADVPIGITLSGGLDSAMILALASEVRPANGINTFSIRIDEPSFDESAYQKILVNQFKTQHHEIVITAKDIENAIFTHIAYLDEPNGNGGNIPSFLLAQKAKHHVTVLLSGEGGDEIFNGYDTHIAYKLSELYKRYVPDSARSLMRAAVQQLPANYQKLSLDFKLKRFTEGAELPFTEAHIFWRHVLTNIEKSSLLIQADRFSNTDSLFTCICKGLPFDDELNKLSYWDTYYYFADDLMVKNDRMFMAHSLETRFPLMDRYLAEYVSTIPSFMRIKKFKRRYIQKQIAKGLIPQAIVNRRKSGLEFPYSKWLLRELKPLCEKYFTKAIVGKSNFLRWETLDTIWRQHQAGKKDYGRALWCVLVYLIWFDLYIENKNFAAYR